MKPITNIDDPRLVKALAHPLRVRILALLENRTASPSELANEIGAPLGNVAYHFRVLQRLGLLKLVRTKKRRGAVEHYYAAVERPSISANAWAQVPPMVKKATVDAALSQVGDYVNAAAAAGGFDRPDAHLTRTEMQLDERGWLELAKALNQLLEKTDRIEEAAAKRLQRADDPGEPVGLAIMMFEAAGFATAKHAGKTARSTAKASIPNTS